jgi:hypothetical protein
MNAEGKCKINGICEPLLLPCEAREVNLTLHTVSVAGVKYRDEGSLGLPRSDPLSDL